MPYKLVLLALLIYLPCSAAEQYQSEEDFLYQAFAGQVPKTKSFWLQKQFKQTVNDILQHRAGFIRTRYWRYEAKTVWILNEVGKTKPITVGIIIDNGKISLLKVLAFRESRGWEVRHAFFTDQFKHAALNDDLSLDKSIDGISGATLSVRALTKTAKLALYFDRQIQP